MKNLYLISSICLIGLLFGTAFSTRKKEKLKYVYITFSERNKALDSAEIKGIVDIATNVFEYECYFVNGILATRFIQYYVDERDEEHKTLVSTRLVKEWAFDTREKAAASRKAWLESSVRSKLKDSITSFRLECK